MKKILSLVLVFIMTISIFNGVTVSATTVTASGTCGDNLAWTLDSDGLFTISGTGDMDTYTSSYDVPWDSYGNSIKTVTIEKGVANIGDWAFSGCSSLNSIDIPDTVTRIGKYAFSGCSSLDSIDIPDTVTSIGKYAFSGCRSITSIEIPNNLRGIGENVFMDCSSLGLVTIPDSVISIANGSFANCLSLISIEIPDGNNKISPSTFQGCSSLAIIYIPDSVTAIYDFAFSNCKSLTDVYYGGTEEQWNKVLIGSANGYLYDANIHYSSSMPKELSGSCGEGVTWTLDSDGLLTISGTGDMEDYNHNYKAPWYGRRDCIKTVVVSNGVTRICDYAFYDCLFLTSIKIPDSVTSIGKSAFCDCLFLTSIEIPDSVKEIGPAAFYGCTNITSIKIPYGVTSIGNDAFSDCSVLASIEIPSSVTSIGDYAFEGCSSLTSIEIPYDVTSIGWGAFWDCSSLASIEIPDRVTSIGDRAFSGCSFLERITVASDNTKYHSKDNCIIETSTNTLIAGCKTSIIPDYVTTIGDRAFSGCSSLISINIPDSVTSIGEYAFEDCCSLISVDLGNGFTSIGYYTFSNCSSLTSIKIPDSVTSIFDYAFYHCESLTSIEIPNSLTSIEYSAFGGCESLADVYYGGTEEQWNEVSVGKYNGYLIDANIHYNSSMPKIVISSGNCGENVTWELDFDGLLTISGTGEMSYYGYNAPWYDRRDSIKTVIIEDGVTNICDNAFYMCTSLTSIEIPSSIISIGRLAFYDCRSLSSVEIPDGVISISTAAFGYCDSLSAIKIPNTVTRIEADAFYGCISIEAITVANENLKYHDKGNCLIETETNTLILGCNISTIPDYVTSIGDYAFLNRKSLTSIEIPSSVTSIGDYAFQNCDSLNNIIIPYNVTDIGVSAFQNCYSLTNVVISDRVTSIGDRAFSGCTVLTDVYYGGTKEQWNEIAIGDYNEYLVDANIHFAEVSVVISGTVKSFGDTSKDVIVELLSDGAVVDSMIVTGNGTYTFENISKGEYTVRISKTKHATRDYDVTVYDLDVTQDVTIWLYGDVTADGVVNATDVMQINRRIANLTSVFNQSANADYRLKVANITAVTGTDTIINATDVMQINRRIANLSSIFDRIA